MPVSKHRRRSKIRPRKTGLPPDGSRQDVLTIDKLRQAVGDPALDFPEKVVVAGAWWFQELFRKVGDRWESTNASEEDKTTAALLLCVAMDGEPGQNDDLSPLLAEMLRPHCSAPTFAEAWEQAKQMSSGTVRSMAAEILSTFEQPVV